MRAPSHKLWSRAKSFALEALPSLALSEVSVTSTRAVTNALLRLHCHLPTPFFFFLLRFFLDLDLLAASCGTGADITGAVGAGAAALAEFAVAGACAAAMPVENRLLRVHELECNQPASRISLPAARGHFRFLKNHMMSRSHRLLCWRLVLLWRH